jgi:hypothetical protein
VTGEQRVTCDACYQGDVGSANVTVRQSASADSEENNTTIQVSCRALISNRIHALK